MTPPRGVEDAATCILCRKPSTNRRGEIHPSRAASVISHPALSPPTKSHRKGAHRHAIHQHYPPLDTRQPADHGAGARVGGGAVPVLQLQRLYGGVERAVENRFPRRGPPAGHGTAGNTATTAESRANVLRRVVEQFDEKDKFEFMLLDAQGVILATSSGTMNRDLTNGTDYGRALTSATGSGRLSSRHPRARGSWPLRCLCLRGGQHRRIADGHKPDAH